MISFSLSMGQRQYLLGLAHRPGARDRVTLTVAAVTRPALLGVFSLARKLDYPEFHLEQQDGREILWSAPPDRTTPGEKPDTGRYGVHVPPVPLIELVQLIGTDEYDVSLTDTGRTIVTQIEEQLAIQGVANVVKSS